MNKTKLNYWTDLVIGIAFVFSAVSGIVFLFPISGSTALGVTYQAWDQIHTWGSLLMIAGVLFHLVLHWKWLVHMTKKTFGVQPQRKTAVAAAAATTPNSVNRREFLRLAGMGILATGVAAVGFKALFEDEETAVTAPEIESATESTTESAAESTTTGQAESIPLNVQNNSPRGRTGSCPKGLTYDPYPGRCHHYVDQDGDGYCDLSV